MDEWRWVRICWEEKRVKDWQDIYSKERVEYDNSNGWGVCAIDHMDREEMDLIKDLRQRERDIQKQMEMGKIKNARYNKKYKDIVDEGNERRYLEKVRLLEKNRDGVRALVSIRCGNMEEANKYWVDKEFRRCKFCELGKDNFEHFLKDCEITKGWFDKLDKDVEERLKNRE